MKRLPGGSESVPPAAVEAIIDRRRFLVLLGGAAAYAALRPHAAWAKRAADAQSSLQSWSLPAEVGSRPADVARALVSAAVLAPSHWNTQPWRFESEQNVVRIVADSQRALPAIDPGQVQLHLSLGASLENLLVAARAYGLMPSVTYLPAAGAPGVVAEVSWTAAEARRDRTLFTAIAERRTNRREYDGRGIYLQNRAQLAAQIPEDLRLHWMDDRDKIRSLADTVHASVKSQVLDPRAGGERFDWMRFGKDARRRGDGIDVDDLQVGGVANWIPGRSFNPKSWFVRFGSEGAAKQARAQIRSSGALALLTAPRGGPAQWIAAGQAYERFALKATTLGIAQQPISEPLESPTAAAEVLSRFGAREEQPLMLVRLGHAKSPKPSVRRSVSLVASFRAS